MATTTTAGKPASIFDRGTSRSTDLTARAVVPARRNLVAVPLAAMTTARAAAAAQATPAPTGVDTGVDRPYVCTLTEDGQLPGAPLPALDLAQPFTPCAGVADTALLAVLAAPLAEGECASEGFARKEGELSAILATLLPADSLRLERRLAAPMPGDVLAAQFQRLVVDRRVRLLRLLSTTRHRANARR